LDKPHSYLYAWPEYEISLRQYQQYCGLLIRRKQGEPIAYITGQQEFWSLPLKVNNNTLIPRAETELLVEQALDKIPINDPYNIVDLGTGSGAIALAIASERPQCHIIATDNMLPTLQQAIENAKRLNSQNIEFKQGHWFEPLQTHSFDMIISNPPYIAEHDKHLKKLVFEPDNALISAKEGLKDLEHIIEYAHLYLKKAGYLLLEHGYNQAKVVNSLLKNSQYQHITLYCDLANQPRVTLAQSS
jgi:release factor glutamine methyltransferase